MSLSKEERMRRQRRRRRITTAIIATFLVLLIVVMCVGIVKLFNAAENSDYLFREGMMFTENGNSRTGRPLTATKIIVQKSQLNSSVAEEIRNYYERGDILNPFDETPVTGGIHYAVGSDGSVINCIPLSEVAPGNPEAFVIEYSPDENGDMGQKTKDAVEKLIKQLGNDYSISSRAEYTEVEK